MHCIQSYYIMAQQNGTLKTGGIWRYLYIQMYNCLAIGFFFQIKIQKRNFDKMCRSKNVINNQRKGKVLRKHSMHGKNIILGFIEDVHQW